MSQHGWAGIMIMNHDDLRYFFGFDHAQPRAILPWKGPPILIAFAAEAPRVQELIGDAGIKVFTHVGEQIQEVVTGFRSVLQEIGLPKPGQRPRVGMQMWFDTPAFLVDLFRKVNPILELVSSDPVMDELRMIKEPDEIALMTAAQRIAALGMDRIRALLRPGVSARELATEALYTMLKAGAERTSTPIHVNVGNETCMLHGQVSSRTVAAGDLVVVDLTPQVSGYCANLARTFVMGAPTPPQERLFSTYSAMLAAARPLLRPGEQVLEIDQNGKQICEAHGLGEFHIAGIGHGIGLRFEETPASTILRQHQAVVLRAGMTMTLGHTILAQSDVGGFRCEDVYRVTEEGGCLLYPYSSDWVMPL